MRFIFKMFVLVGLIVVGKFLKEDNANGVAKEQDAVKQEAYSQKQIVPLPFTQQTNFVLEPITKEGVITEKNFTYSLN